jgi:DNA-binding MarR family transcriptional regulator
MTAIRQPHEHNVLADAHAHDNDRVALRAWLRMLACTNLIERRVRAGLRDAFATTLPRFDVLAQLDTAMAESPRGLTMSELSRRLMVTNGNLTSLVERLVHEKLVSRVTSPTDRRTQLVRLTSAGKRALDAMTPEHRAWIDDMFATLTQEERMQLHTILGKLKENLQ